MTTVPGHDVHSDGVVEKGGDGRDPADENKKLLHSSEAVHSRHWVQHHLEKVIDRHVVTRSINLEAA